jgi:N-acetylmuramoyl-L-alanine amidase
MIKIIKQLIPPSAKGRRPGIPMKAKYITIHSTGNPRSTAKNEADNVTRNDPGKQVSFHFVVDDKKIYQVMPTNEVAWHAGDGAGRDAQGRDRPELSPGNRMSIGIEICESGDRRKALLNAAELVRSLMASEGIPLANIVQHNRWSGKNCPRILRDKAFIKDGMDWNWFLAQIKGEDGELAAAKETIKAKAGLSADTIAYLAAYKYGKDLIIKLAKAMG